MNTDNLQAERRARFGVHRCVLVALFAVLNGCGGKPPQHAKPPSDAGADAMQADSGAGTVQRLEFCNGVDDDNDQAIDEDCAVSGTLLWTIQSTGTGTCVGVGLAALGDGGVVITGRFEGHVTFGAGEVNEITLSADGGSDTIFVAKYDPDGALVWAKGMNGPAASDVGGVAVLADDGIAVTGTFMTALTLGPGESGEARLVSVGIDDSFVAKFGSDGALVWARSAGGTLEGDAGYGVAAMPDGSVVVTGRFMYSATFGLGDIEEVTLLSRGLQDAFVARYSAIGTLMWAERAGGIADDRGRAIIATSDGGTLIVGQRGDVPLNSGGNVADPTDGAPFLVSRFDADGLQLWAQSAAQATRQSGTGATALPDGSAIVAGTFMGTAVLGASQPNETTLTAVGENDIFLARYRGDGDLVWALSAGTEQYDSVSAIVLAADRAVVVSGTVSSGALSAEPATFGASTTALRPGWFLAKLAP